MDTASSLATVKEFQKRLEALADAGRTPEFRVQQEILENDLDEFMQETFEPGSPDYLKLDAVLHPMVFGYGGDPWKDTLGDYRRYFEALLVIEHRLEKGQARLKTPDEPDEHVIEAGTPHSAYVTLREILQKATKTILIVDPYVGSDLFGLLATVPSSVSVRILTYRKRVPNDFPTELAKFVAQYGHNIEVRCGKSDFRDRFLTVDDRLFHSGASFKDFGKKISMVQEIKDARALVSNMLAGTWKAAQGL